MLRRLQGVVEGIIKLHDGRLISAAVAVVWRAKNGDNISVV